MLSRRHFLTHTAMLGSAAREKNRDLTSILFLLAD